MKTARRLAGWPFTGIGWLFFGVGWTFLFVAGCFFQLGGDIAGESDELDTSNNCVLSLPVV
jgi:hypothetical protein